VWEEKIARRGFVAIFLGRLIPGLRVAMSVIGGTAMLGGQGTILGAFLGGIVLATLINGLNVAGISANPLNIVFGLAILLSMIANVRLARLRAAGRN